MGRPSSGPNRHVVRRQRRCAGFSERRNNGLGLQLYSAVSIRHRVQSASSRRFAQPRIRRALNAAIDRVALVRDGLDGRGAPSSGPIWPQHWALTPDLPGFEFAPQDAASERDSRLRTARCQHQDGVALRFKCLISAEYERLGLLVKRQLEMVGVEMEIEEASPDRVLQALNDSSFEAVFLDMVSGPSLFRTYHGGTQPARSTRAPWAVAPLIAALDRIRYAASDDEYRARSPSSRER